MTYNYQLKDGTNYQVRRAQESDLDQLLQVLLKVAEEDQVATLTYSEAQTQILSSKERLQKLLRDQDQHFIYLIGLVNGQIISFCDIHIGKSERNKHIAEFGRSVLKDWRRTGAGKMIQACAIEFVRKLKSIEKISLNISSLNESSLKSCQTNGFTFEASRKKELKFQDGNYADILTYVLYL
jgi:RimJ/RimL family protein N-acetyltransferase